ncbi:MAG TPA: metal-dependent transcriptional regulator [bacterium]|nr:metal-dependent transcriptional regulator [bacterium]HOC25424.1 metal-dependent transcriptional regulator [bacterium]HOY43402.1 metal-dependent transcriptional regulator [bacterium]HPG83187.1 metal-dependent transcriptional regulator [bacterium]HPM58307.1 metal-dependent transcriptional regulator [bacterium]
MDISHDLLTQEYIEVIRDLEKKNRVARIKDIASVRGVTCANVSVAMTNLARKELVVHEQYGHVVLTSAGRRLARNLEKRHLAIRRFMTDVLGLETELAESEACKLEHVMSPLAMQAISRFLLFVERCPKRDRENVVLFRLCGLFGDSAADCSECAQEGNEEENPAEDEF